MYFTIAAVAALGCLCATRVLGQATVTLLPTDFLVRAISDDGRVAVGSSNFSGARWTAEEGLTVIDQPLRYSGMIDVSADGGTATGFIGRSPVGSPTYWRENEEVANRLPSDSSGVASVISADGRVIAGALNQNPTVGTPARWEFQGGVPQSVSLGLGLDSLVSGLSGDGAVMVGTIQYSSLMSQAFVWTAGTGAISLGGPGIGSRADAVSRDGTVVFGTSGGQVFRWTRETGMVALSDPKPPFFPGIVANNDGGLAVGFGEFIWMEGAGFIPAIQWLSERGADVDGWSISQLTDLSGDGSTVAGNGRDPDGVFRSFIITGIGAVPEPSTYGIAAVGVLILATIGRRKRRESMRFGSLRSVLK